MANRYCLSYYFLRNFLFGKSLQRCCRILLIIFDVLKKVVHSRWASILERARSVQDPNMVTKGYPYLTEKIFATQNCLTERWVFVMTKKSIVGSKCRSSSTDFSSVFLNTKPGCDGLPFSVQTRYRHLSILASCVSMFSEDRTFLYLPLLLHCQPFVSPEDGSFIYNSCAVCFRERYALSPLPSPLISKCKVISSLNSKKKL